MSAGEGLMTALAERRVAALMAVRVARGIMLAVTRSALCELGGTKIFWLKLEVMNSESSRLCGSTLLGMQPGQVLTNTVHRERCR